MVGMGMGDDHGVDPLDGQAGLLEPRDQLQPGFAPRQARIDQGDASFVFHGVAVDVAQTGKGDGELHPDHPRSDLGGVGGGRKLLLAHAAVLRRLDLRLAHGRNPK